MTFSFQSLLFMCNIFTYKHVQITRRIIHKHANSSKDDIKFCKMSMHKTPLEFWGKKKLMTFCGIDEVV